MKHLLSFVAALFLCVGASFADTADPTHSVGNCENRCAEVSKQCNANCDRQSTGKDHGKTFECVNGCGDRSKGCYMNCKTKVKECSVEFSYCSNSAKSGDEKQKCTNSYHHCKGTGNN
jgi:hypothetical protein